ncbi:MAG: hypothetical protein F4Z31_07130 [Gemmatimonadetes bacterium]|nr:hypothetical protein [Gammaproteobacteria bacterium]MYA41507.1 hypothetical protein [Gemmatimonadota bacterium]MYE94053.1 hypothetical protein [Gemmatimonadota bacterium]MYJ12170.1 hypothetical protein [Gemmatimonadota bacterium]
MSIDPRVWRETYQRLIGSANGPRAIVRTCRICGHTLVTRKPLRPGRGWGFREGNKLRGRMIRHIRAEHPEALPGGDR